MSNRRKLYDALIQDYDMGTFEQFEVDIQDDAKRKKLFDAISSDYDMGTYDQFSAQVLDGLTTSSDGSVRVAEEPKEEPKRWDERLLGKITNAATRFNDRVTGDSAAYLDTHDIYGNEKEQLSQAEIDQRAAMRQMLQDNGTIEYMEELEKEARKAKRKERRQAGLMAMAAAESFAAGSPSTSVFSDLTQEHAKEWSQNKAMEQTLDEVLDKARAGDVGGIGEDNIGNEIVDAGLGLWDSATRASTWDMGVSNAINGLTVYQVLEKWERDPESLTSTERNLLDAMGMASAVQEAYADQVGIGYNVGASLPESAGFMVSMYLNPASGMGKAAARQAVRKYGRQSIAKNMARIGGDIAETAIMTATTGSGRVVADALERINGSTTYEMDPYTGIVMYGGQKDQETVGHAVLKAIGSNFIENYSEALGEYFDPLLGMSRRLTAGGLRKMNLNKWADALSDVEPSQMAASIRSLREKAKFGGIFGEIMEEEVGMALNAISVGDYTFSKEEADASNGKKQWVFDLENQLTTALSCAIMSGAITGFETASNVKYRREMERGVSDAEKAARAAVGDELIEQIDQSSPEGMVDILRDAYMDSSLTLKQRRALADYATQRVRMQYYNAANAKARRQVNKAQQDMNDAYEAGFYANLEQMFGIDQAVRSAEQVINDMPNAEMLWDAVHAIEKAPKNEHENILSGLADNERQLVLDYLNAQSREQGVIDGRAEQVEGLVNEFAETKVEPFVVTDANGNRTVTSAIYKGQEVHITAQNGKVATILLPDGRKVMDGVDALENVQTQNADEMIELFRQATTAAVDKETEKNLNYPTEVQEPAEGVTVETLDGKQWQVAATDGENVELVGMIFDKKSGQWLPNAGDYRKMTREQFMDWQKAELDRKKANTYEQGDELTFYVGGGEPISAEITGINPDGNYVVHISHLADGLNKAVSDVYTAEELRKLTTPTRAGERSELDNVSEKTTENESTPTEEIKQSVSEDVTNSQVEDNVTGPAAEVAESVNSAQTKAAELLAELDEDEVDENIAYNTQKAIDLAEEKRKARPTMKEADGDVATYKALKAKWEAELNELQKGVLFWSNVAKEVSNARVASQTIVPEVEAEQPVVVQPMDMNPQPAKKAKKSRNRESVSFEGFGETAMKTANDIMADKAPQNGVELAAAMLSGSNGKDKIRLTPESFRKHTGYTTKEQGKFVGLFSSNGVSMERMGELVMQADREDGTNFFDQNDANAGLNAVLEVLGQAETMADINQYITRNREEVAWREASAIQRQEDEQEQMAKDAWYMERYHATEEELAAYNEWLNEETQEFLADEEGYERRIINFAEQLADYDNEGTDASLLRAAAQGEGNGPVAEGSSSVGEAERTDNSREVLGNVEGAAAEDDGAVDEGILAQSDAERAARIAGYRSLSEVSEEDKGTLTDEEIDDIIGRQHEDEEREEREGPVYTEERLDNGDVRITGTRSNGEVASVSIERNGKVVQVDTYEDGALFERTDYDENGNATKVTRYKDGEVISEQEYKDGKRPVTANYFEMAEEVQKKRKEESNDKLVKKNHQQKENRSETQGVGNRPQLQDAESYESFINELGGYLQHSYKGSQAEEITQIIREHNKGKTILARTEQDKELLKTLRVMTNKDIDWLISELKAKRDATTDATEHKKYDDAVSLATRYRGRGEHNAVVRALTGANLREKLPLSKIDELFDKYNSDADVAELYRRVRAIAELIGLDFWFDDNMIDAQTGGFRKEDNRVRLNAHMLYSSFVSDQEKATTIVHEILHAVADYAIETQRDIKLGITPKVQLSKQVLSAANTILNIYEKVVKNNPLLVHEEYDYATGQMRVVPDYGTTSAREMLMEISKPEFRDKLKQIEYKNRSVWQRIVDTLKSMFTKSSDVTNPTAYDSMAKALDVLINEFSVDAYRKYSGNGEESAARVYHGSGADFDRFDHSFMGTGEGNQAFGWGTYVSEAEGVGKTYAKIASKPMLTYKGQEMNVDGYENPWRVIKDLYDMTRGKISQMRADAEKYERLAEDDSPFKPVWGEIIGILKNARRGDIKVTPRRVLYSVEIPDNNGSNYLEWYEAVPKELLNKAKQKLYDILIEGDYKGAERELKRELDDLFALEQTGQNLYGNISAYLGSDKEASQFLRELGIVGMKYPTNTLHGGNIDGTNNYVIFDENDLEIVDNIRFRDGAPFFSNAERAVENIKQNKATPEQWLAMIKKDGGLKAGEDKWMGLSDWLNEQKTQGVKTLTKDEVLAFIRDNQIEIEEVEYNSNPQSFEDLKEEYEELLREEGSDAAHDIMVDRFGDDFDIAFDDLGGELTIADEEAAATLLGSGNIINSTRLDYTTEGLENKKEIAFVVPSIEPWNQTDAIHFGDAGEGRAVAWVRFGDTTDEDGNRVLAIDEVQSKRHDEGRAKGYQSKEKGDLLAERERLYDKMYRDGLTEEEFNRRNEINARLEELGEGRIPDAPFDKNYYEVVMKRMLRYAAENGFDKVAWTKGKQQAERYGLSQEISEIAVKAKGNGKYLVVMEDKLGSELMEYRGSGKEMTAEELSSLVGNELSQRLIEGAEKSRGKEWNGYGNNPEYFSVRGEDLSIGGEDRGALYDKMIPSFMRKYVKKWGTTVGEVTLPEVEEAGRTMWSVDVTPEMRESVMQGQPMFREGMGAISDREVSYENDPIAKWQGKPRYYGKRAAAFAERERRRMHKGVEDAAKILGIEVEIITDASTLKGRKAKAKGWYDINSKKVVVVIPNHVSKGDAVRTVLHEGIAHHGLRELFGDGFDAMLDNIYNNVAPELKARIDAIAERTGVSTSVATEEYLASLAEDTEFEYANKMGWWDKIKRFFVDMLRKLSMPGLNLKEEITDNELRFLLWRSYQNLVDPNRYLKPLGYIDDVAKQKELKVGNYAENTMATPRVAEMSEAEEWSAITMQRIEELEAQAAQLENDIADMEADRDADDASRYDIWEEQLDVLRKQSQEIYDELEGLYSLEAEDEDIEAYEEEREAEKQRQLYQKRIDNAYLKAVREGNWEEATDLFRQYVLSKAEDEGIVPMDYGVGYRGGAHSSIAKKVKEENPDAIAEAAYQMSVRIPKGSILVPMPSRTGNATYTVKLAEAIAKATESEVRDVLKGKARMSVYEAKQKGIKMTPEDLGMYTTEELPKGKNIVIIDNVIDKGTTALAAVSAVKGASVVAYAYTLGDKQRVATLKLAEPVTYDDNKRIIPLSQRFDKETDDIRYRMSINEEEFDNTQREAVRNIGIVMPNLGDAEVNIVDVPRHDFTGTGNEAISKAKEWANRELVGEHVANEGTKEEFKYSIDEKSVKKFLSGVSTSLSDNLGVHLSVLKKLPSVIDSSIEAEIHADYKKGEQRDANNGIEDENLLIHRLYGCAKINGELYRVKTTVKERKSAGVKPYTYEVTKIELLDGSSQEGTSSSDASSNSISGAKLLKGVEKSYDKGKLLLDESKKVSKDSRTSEEIVSEVEREAAALGVPVRIARSVDELNVDENTRQRAIDGGLKGYFDTETGEVVLYEPNATDANDAKRTVLHEVVGYKGLRELIGEENYDKMMVRMLYLLPEAERMEVLRRAERHGWNAAIAMDEYLAEKAEEDATPTWWGRINSWVRAVLRNMGFDVKLTNADVKYLLWRSSKKLMGDDAFGMAFNNKLKRAARQSARAEAWAKDNVTWETSDSAVRERGVEQGEEISDKITEHYEKYAATTNAKWFIGGLGHAIVHMFDGGPRRLLNDLSEKWFENIRVFRRLEEGIEKAEGKALKPHEMIHKSINAEGSINAREMEISNDRYFAPLAELVGKILGRKIGGRKIEVDDIERYLICKHAPERNKFLMGRAHAENRRKKIAERAKELMEGNMTKEEAIAQATSEYTLHQSDFRDDYSGLTELFKGVTIDGRTPTIDELEQLAAEEVARFEEATKGLYGELWSIIRALNNDTIKKAYESGLISRSLFYELKKRFQYYVPLQGAKNDYAPDIYDYVTNGVDVGPLQTVVKTAFGTKHQARNILGSMFAMNTAAITQGNHNRVKQLLYNLALNHNTGVLQIVDLWQVEENGEWKAAPAPVLNEQMTKTDIQKTLTDYHMQMRELEKEGKARRVVNSMEKGFGLNIDEKDMKNHYIKLLVNGREQVIWVNGNPKLAQAMNGLLDKKLSFEDYHFKLGDIIIDGLNKALARTQTSINPEFLLGNAQRDLKTATESNLVQYGPKYQAKFMGYYAQLMPISATTNKDMRKQMGTSAVGIWRLFMLDRNTHSYDNYGKPILDMNNRIHREFLNFLNYGGKTGYVELRQAEDIQTRIKRLGGRERTMFNRLLRKYPAELVEGTLNTVEKFNEGIENATRFAAYLTMRDMGKSVQEAIYEAKEVSVNFNMHGSGGWGNALFRKGYNYFNVALQSLRKEKVKFGTSPWSALSAKAFLIAHGFIWSLIMYNLSGDDDDENEYASLSDWNRWNYINIFNPIKRKAFTFNEGEENEHEGFIHWALPQDQRAFYAIGCIIYEMAEGYITPEHGLRSILAQINNYTPLEVVSSVNTAEPDKGFMEDIREAFVPSLAQPFHEVKENEDFLGRQINNKNEYNEYEPEWQRAGYRTPEWAINVSKALSKATGGEDHKRGKIEVNPSDMFHILNSYGGGTIDFIEKVVNLGEFIAKSEKDKENELRDYPFVSKVFVETSSDHSKQRIVNDRYDMYEVSYETTKNRVKGADKDYNKAKGILDVQLRDKKISQTKYLEEIAKIETHRANEKKRISEDSDFYIYEIYEAYKKTMNEAKNARSNAYDTKDEDGIKVANETVFAIKKAVVDEIMKRIEEDTKD